GGRLSLPRAMDGFWKMTTAQRMPYTSGRRRKANKAPLQAEHTNMRYNGQLQGLAMTLFQLITGFCWKMWRTILTPVRVALFPTFLPSIRMPATRQMIHILKPWQIFQAF